MRINKQFRMCPAVSEFVRPYYPGGLVDAEMVKKDNSIREIVRQLAKGFGLPRSEVMVVNMERAISRLEPNGTSLQNYANADMIEELVASLLRLGAKPHMITILVFYSGQKKLLESRLNAHSLEKSAPLTNSRAEKIILSSSTILPPERTSTEDPPEGMKRPKEITSREKEARTKKACQGTPKSSISH